jgi:hypothetical protein
MMFEIAIQDSDKQKLTTYLEVSLYELGQKMSICLHVSSRITLSVHASSAIQTGTDGRAVVDVVLALSSRKATRALAGVIPSDVDAGGAVLAWIRIGRLAFVHIFVAMTTGPTNRTHALVILIIVGRLTLGSVLASVAGTFYAVTRIQSHVAMFSGPWQVADAFIRVDEIQTFSVCARTRLAVVDILVTIRAGVAIDADAVVGSLVTATISPVLTRIRKAPVDLALASKAREAQGTVASEFVNSIDASTAINARIRLALILFGETLAVVITRRTVASVGVDEILATAAIVARVRLTFVNVLLAIDALISSLTFAGVTVDPIGAGAPISTRVRGALVVVDTTIRAPSTERTIALVSADQILAFALILAWIVLAFVYVHFAKGSTISFVA